MSDNVGRVVFGPTAAPTEDWRREYMRRLQGVATQIANVQPCNCIGPQPGETKCPCALRGESEKGSAMVRDGVTVNGVRYRLVREDTP